MYKLSKILTLATLASCSWLFGETASNPYVSKGPIYLVSSNIQPIEDLDSFGIDLSIGMLFQRPAVAGMLAGSIVYANSPTPQQEVGNRINFNENFDYAVGLTFAAGMDLHYDDWRIEGTFEWLQSSHQGYFEDPDGTNSEPFLYPGSTLNTVIFTGTAESITFPTMQSITYKATLDFCQLEVLLKKGSYYSNSFSYTPCIGIGSLWYKSVQQTDNVTRRLDGRNIAKGKISAYDWGVGPMCGVDALFFFSDNCGIYGDVRFGALYGDAHQTDTSILMGAAGTSIVESQEIQDSSYESGQLFGTSRIGLGIQLQHLFIKKRVHLAFKLGYDSRIVLAYPNIGNGMTMTGLYTSLTCNF